MERSKHISALLPETLKWQCVELKKLEARFTMNLKPTEGSLRLPVIFNFGSSKTHERSSALSSSLLRAVTLFRNVPELRLTAAAGAAAAAAGTRPASYSAVRPLATEWRRAPAGGSQTGS